MLAHCGDVLAHWGDVLAHCGDVLAHCWRCAGSLVAHQTSGAEVPGSNPASSPMILRGSARSLCNTVKSLGSGVDLRPNKKYK